MSSATVELDKQFTTDAGDTYGTISIRVVVLKPKAKDDKDDDDEAALAPEPEDEDLDVGEAGKKSPLASYLEKQAHGKWCVVFLVNGQRHHSWDKTFIVKDLGFNQLRDRTMVIVDLDGLAMHAMAEIIQGSRQGLFESKVYFTIRDRIIQTLKTDPQLKKLQIEAEQKILEMETGDEAVKSKLDQLIEGHHAAAHTDGPGNGDAGLHSTEAPHFSVGAKSQDVVVMGQPSLGQDGELPVLTTDPRIGAVRMHPGQSKAATIIAWPREEWANLEDFRVQFATAVDGLTFEETCGTECSSITIRFDETDDFDDEEYPVQGELQAFARFKGRAEARMLTLPVVVTKKKDKTEKVPIELLDEPTYLKVKSRQPIKIVPGGPAIHVKLEWNGREALIRSTSPPWKFNARCVTLSTFPKIGFASMGDGRLELVLYPPHGMLPNTQLEFEVIAKGPDDKQLPATFRALVVEPPALVQGGARKVAAEGPETAGQRRPPYELKYISQKDWGNPERPRWDSSDWTADDAGRFIDQTETNPLVLVINQDMQLVKSFRDDMVKRRLVETTIKDRVNRYISHVAFHLYQMYGEYKKAMDAKPTNDSIKPPSEQEMQAEINRVGTTIMKLMDFGQR